MIRRPSLEGALEEKEGGRGSIAACQCQSVSFNFRLHKALCQVKH